MANSRLEGKYYAVPEELQRFLGTSISYENLKMTKTRMTQAKNNKNEAEFNKKGGIKALEWIEETLKTNRNAIYNVKKIGKDAGRENQFIKKHEKDRDNKNPTKIGGLPKLNKGNISRKILSNKEVYNESFMREIDKIKYLILYMNNKNKKIL